MPLNNWSRWVKNLRFIASAGFVTPRTTQSASSSPFSRSHENSVGPFSKGYMKKIEFNAQIHIDNPSPRCPVCLTSANVYKRKVEPNDNFEGWCEVCGGNVRITEAAVQQAHSSQKGHLLVAWLRRRPPQEREELPKHTLRSDDVEQILKDSPDYSVLDKLDLTLIQIAAATTQPGAKSSFRFETDWPLVYAANSEEALFYQRQVADLGYIEAAMVPRLRAQGYHHLSEIQKTGKNSDI